LKTTDKFLAYAEMLSQRFRDPAKHEAAGQKNWPGKDRAKDTLRGEIRRYRGDNHPQLSRAKRPATAVGLGLSLESSIRLQAPRTGAKAGV
jgi:hypothetical protein